MSSSSSPSKQADKPANKAEGTLSSALGTMSLPLTTLSSLLTMQDNENDKPRLSKISWLPDILVFRSSIIPTILGPVLSVTLFAIGVALAALLWGKEVGLTNNVVPLLSVVVGLLLVFRNSSAYERYAEGRKDFTVLVSNARNLSRLIWVSVTPPPPPTDSIKPAITREQITEEKKRLIRLVVAFVIATKHHLRAEGGVHHDDLRGLLPPKLARLHGAQLRSSTQPIQTSDLVASPKSISGSPIASSQIDEEASLGLQSPVMSRSFHSTGNIPIHTGDTSSPTTQSLHRSSWNRLRPDPRSTGMKRRPTAVRVVYQETDDDDNVGVNEMTERTPLIKPGVKPDIRKNSSDPTVDPDVLRRAEKGLGRMVELGLPLIIAHEISRTIFKFRKLGYLEVVGPAGVNALQGLVQSMTDQLGAMERIVQTPLPYVFCVHLKQCVSLYLFVLPFTLVDVMGWRMVPLVTVVAFTLMGVEGIAAEIEMPFGTDPSDLNLDLYCTELLCECEALLERLPEGDDLDDPIDDELGFNRSERQKGVDYLDDGGDDGCDD